MAGGKDKFWEALNIQNILFPYSQNNMYILQNNSRPQRKYGFKFVLNFTQHLTVGYLQSILRIVTQFPSLPQKGIIL